jgi:ribosomal protein S18 acetylase RimI-like enzyme
MLTIRPAQPKDADAIWTILQPIIRAGEVFTTPRDMDREAALAHWFAGHHEVFVAEEASQGDGKAGDESRGEMVGTYFLCPNQPGGGAHVANCGYATAPAQQGRGVARAMCIHSLDHAKQRGFRAMQFNFVVVTNQRALRLWQSCGFETVGRLPEAFLHPTAGYVDACVMFRAV